MQLETPIWLSYSHSKIYHIKKTVVKERSLIIDIKKRFAFSNAEILHRKAYSIITWLSGLKIYALHCEKSRLHIQYDYLLFKTTIPASILGLMLQADQTGIIILSFYLVCFTQQLKRLAMLEIQRQTTQEVYACA